MSPCRRHDLQVIQRLLFVSAYLETAVATLILAVFDLHITHQRLRWPFLQPLLQ